MLPSRWWLLITASQRPAPFSLKNGDICIRRSVSNYYCWLWRKHWWWWHRQHKALPRRLKEASVTISCSKSDTRRNWRNYMLLSFTNGGDMIFYFISIYATHAIRYIICTGESSHVIDSASSEHAQQHKWAVPDSRHALSLSSQSASIGPQH